VIPLDGIVLLLDTMMLRLQCLALLGAILALPLNNLCTADVSSIPSDTPIASLKNSARSLLTQGAYHDALSYFDAAIARDPSDYGSIFQRGATYLALGRNAQASADFDRVLEVEPSHDSARRQRAKIRARNADWAGAKDDYKAVGKQTSREIAELDEAEGAAYLAAEAEKHQDWEACIHQAGVAIMTASTALSLRQLRAKCRFERGEVQEGVSDLTHVLQIHPSLVNPHLQISSMLFYSLGDTERGLAQIRKCLHSDPDSKLCKTLFRREKTLSKTIEKLSSLMESRQFNSATKILVGTNSENDRGLLMDLKADVAEAKESGIIHPSSPNNLYALLVERTCECYREMNSPRKAAPYCAEALTLNPKSLHGLLYQAQKELEADEFDAAIATLNSAKDHHPNAQAVHQKLQEAQVLLKRSKQKDYYKVLDVPRDADERTIKRAYRTLTKVHHPDKATVRGTTKEQAEKKMAQINEAYEVLSDPELKAKFDQGEDPNDPIAQQGGHPFQGSPFGAGQQFFFQQGGFPGGGGQQFKFHAGGGGGNPFGGFPFGG
jgi:DnaJ family protein C protein 3